ncbi:NADH-quinone oxidoreductase subunit D [Streptomyces sp. NPDC085927]|uniref:NADH-quinone oxidoreductase subunit D n=1 Tax=Streptomyces sp. NPDC085927 TaxID=3365738 RepID=UPI0037D1A551
MSTPNPSPGHHPSSSPSGTTSSTASATSAASAASARETTEGTVYTVTGGDWDEVVETAQRSDDERIIVNMGPQHPSTHGVLRLILEIDGETVSEARCGIGYLHTGIEKNLEYRNWTQGTTFVTRMDYLTPFFNETAYCLGVEKLLGIEDQIPDRASVIRVLLMELNRLSSHLVCVATGGMELGATTIMIYGFRDRELILDAFELITGLRMNHAYIRPGGLAQDLPPGAVDQIRELVKKLRKNLPEYDALATGNPIFKARMQDVGYLDLSGCMALGATGPVLRSTGLPHDLRKAQPYCGYETYDFEVPTADTCDSYGRFLIRLEEMRQSLRIVEQCLDRLQPGPVMVADKKIAWPAQLAMGPDGLGNSLDHIKKIMGTSMEALIHHFKLVTEGFRVPPGQVYAAVESPKGELGAHVVSDGGTRPFRVHFRDPSFTNLQAMAAMCEGGQVADVIVAVASLDPVMGGVDR